METMLDRKLPDYVIELRPPITWKSLLIFCLVIYPLFLSLSDWWIGRFDWRRVLFMTVFMMPCWCFLFYINISTNIVRLDQRAIARGSKRILWEHVGSYRVLRRPSSESEWRQLLKNRSFPQLEFTSPDGSVLGKISLAIGTPEKREDAIEYVRSVLGEPGNNNGSR